MNKGYQCSCSEYRKLWCRERDANKRLDYDSFGLMADGGSVTETTSDDKTVLLVSNRNLNENAGRAEKFSTRARLLREYGWRLKVAYVEPTVQGFVPGSKRCIQLARQVDVINSVSNPPHLHIAGAIAARVTGTPWLAEFRDPLVENPDVTPNSLAAKSRQWIEQYILTHADQVVWYDGIQIPDDYFSVTYPTVPSNRYRQLPPIGYERRKFDTIEPVDMDSFTVTYAGSFYEGWIEPYTFIDGLKRYVDVHPNTNIQALFYGDWSNSYDQAVTAAELNDFVYPRPFIPHEELVGVMKGSSALLYIGGDDPRNQLNLPTKLYDYIGAGQPIIAIVDSSFRVAKFIEDYKFGIIVQPDNPEGVCSALERINSGDFNYISGQNMANEFTRKYSMNAYVETLEEILLRSRG